MQNSEDGIGEALAKSFNANRQQHRLQLSDPEDLKAEQAEVEKRQQYAQSYWQRYKQKKKRIFGTLPIQVYRDLAARAEAHDKTPWQLIWAEAKAYRECTILPTQELAEQQRSLIAELRRVGNNLNQLARLGHVQARRDGGEGLAAAPDDTLGQETLRQFHKLEAKIEKFSEDIDEQLRVRPRRRSGHGAHGDDSQDQTRDH